jgi:hypothetical protein
LADLPYIGTSITGPSSNDSNDFELKVGKGAPNGYAPLDANSKVPSANLPVVDVSGQIATHNSATTSVHGITNTAELIHSTTVGPNTGRVVTFNQSGGSGGGDNSEISAMGFGVENTSEGKTAFMDTDGFHVSENAKSIQVEADKIELDNGAKLQKGTTDGGLGGNKGIALKCSADYELKWESGRLYTMQQDGFTIRSVEHCMSAPTANHDSSKGYVVGSRWVMDDGSAYNCINNDLDSAVWVYAAILDNKVILNNNSATSGAINLSGGADGDTIPNEVSGNGGSIASVGAGNADGTGGNGGSINLNAGTDSGHGGSIDLSGRTYSTGGSIISTGARVATHGGSLDMSAFDDHSGGSINTKGGHGGDGGSINTSNNGGYINTSGGGGYINTSGNGGIGGSISLNGGNVAAGVAGGSGGTLDLSGGNSHYQVVLNVGARSNVGGNAGSINLKGGDALLNVNGGTGGSVISTGFANASLSTNGGTLNMSAGGNGAGGSINTSNGGGSIDTRGTGSIQLGVTGTRTTLNGSASGSDKTITLPNATGTIALTSHTHGNLTSAGAVPQNNSSYSSISPQGTGYTNGSATINGASVTIGVNGSGGVTTLNGIYLNNPLGTYPIVQGSNTSASVTIAASFVANLPLITTTSGVVTTGTFGTTANSFCQGNDARLGSQTIFTLSGETKTTAFAIGTSYLFGCMPTRGPQVSGAYLNAVLRILGNFTVTGISINQYLPNSTGATLTYQLVRVTGATTVEALGSSIAVAGNNNLTTATSSISASLNSGDQIGLLLTLGGTGTVPNTSSATTILANIYCVPR